MKLGFIGFGEVGFEIARGLKTEGLAKIVAYDPLMNDSQYGILVKDRAKSAGVTLRDTAADVAGEADIVVAAVPGGKALAAALEAMTALGPGKIYFDVSTSTPRTKQKIAALAQSRGAGFVDGAMMGALSIYQHKVPIMISGDYCDRLISQLRPYHMNLEKISDIPGDAIAVKLVRSIYTKGVASLALEMLEVAAALKVEALVIRTVAQTMDAAPFEKMMNLLVTAGSIHAERQAHEMEDVKEVLTELAIAPTMTDATAKRLRWLAEQKLRDRFKGKKPERWEQVVGAWARGG